MALLSLAKLTKNISSSLTIAMSGIIRGISARAFLTARIITLRSICLVKTNRKGRPRRINTDPSSARLSFLTRIWSLLAMQMYPGNESEKPYIRNDDGRNERPVTRFPGETVQVADKGLNCARNIYAAVKEADDGYIFSKAIRGTGLSAKEKQWILLEKRCKRMGKSHGQRRYALVSAQILHRYLYVPVQRNGSGNRKRNHKEVLRCGKEDRLL